MIKYYLSKYKSEIDTRLRYYDEIRLMERFWSKDAGLWSSESAQQKMILERLGWMEIPEWMESKISSIQDFVRDIKKNKFSSVVLLGMGGSSLCPYILSSIFGQKKDYPLFYMLDSTVPESILNLESKLNLKKTLFILASKSGGTIEPNSHFKYFWEKLSKLKNNKSIGEHFCAITDPDTYLHQLAKERQFRKIFINPPDIGGRYSALSNFGLVPAALMGIDIKKILKSANRLQNQSIKSIKIDLNPSVYLGIILGEFAKSGRDKLIFIIPGILSPFGLWLEQLIAESTGKQGKGVIPIIGDTTLPAVIKAVKNTAKSIALEQIYRDKIFIIIKLKNEKNKNFDNQIKKLKQAGIPIITITLPDRYALGAEFYRWEIATAMMGVALNIDPFDQPDVQSAKDRTNRLLLEFQQSGKFPVESPKLISGTMKIYYADNLDYILRRELKSWNGNINKLTDLLVGYLKLANPMDYLAILAYLPESLELELKFNRIRKKFMTEWELSSIYGYGPRYLHSIGQLYKGGSNSGLFILLVGGDKKDIKIPKEKYSFGQLKLAQAFGDYQAMQSAQRRIIKIDLGYNYLQNIDILYKSIDSALEILGKIK